MAVEFRDPPAEHDRLTWTLFWDMHSGGSSKTRYDKIYIQAPEAEAREIFREKFGQDPDDVACNCCGPNFSVMEYEDGLRYVTAFHRNVEITDDGTEIPQSWTSIRRPMLTVGEYCRDDSVLVLYTRARGEEL